MISIKLFQFPIVVVLTIDERRGQKVRVESSHIDTYHPKHPPAIQPIHGISLKIVKH